MIEKKAFKLADLASLTDGILVGDPQHEITGIADLQTATIREVSFLSNSRYLQSMKQSQAGAIIIDEKAPRLPEKNYIITQNPSKAFQALIDFFYPPRSSPSGFAGIHSTAVIHPTAHLAESVQISPYAVIDEMVEIGRNTFIGAGSYIGPNTIIGSDCQIHPRVTIRENSLIGDRVIIQPGAVIGSCGFGYITEKGMHKKLNQAGYVHLEDDVEIGANTTVDRARFQCTKIGKGSKIDNLVQIGHAVQIGENNIIVAQTGIAGSSTTGKYVVIAGQVAIAGHLHLDDHVSIAGKSGVTKSLSAGKYGGIPAIPLEQYNRNQVLLKRIDRFIHSLTSLEKQMHHLS